MPADDGVPPLLPDTLRWLTPAIERALRFVVGLGVIIHQTAVAHQPETLLVGAGLILAGSPLANWADDKRRYMRGDGT